MGTHGLYGYILNGIYYLMYVHFDGDMLMSVMKRESYVILKHFGSIEKTKENFEEIKYIYGNELKPTKKIIEKLKPWTNLEVNAKSTNSWYCLLYHCQKSLIHTLESGFILLKNTSKPTNSIPNYDGYICWWNLDLNIIECYFGNKLIESLYPNELIANKPKNFPIKNYDEIVKNFYSTSNENYNKIEEKNKLLNYVSNIPIPNKIFESNNYDQEEMKNKFINMIEIELKDIKLNIHNSYINLLWKDLGVIHYE